ncbi:hypothetical protein YPPY61_2142, partial [Yersinia pestis PY-61]
MNNKKPADNGGGS